jgi:hypothetical protein
VPAAKSFSITLGVAASSSSHKTYPRLLNSGVQGVDITEVEMERSKIALDEAQDAYNKALDRPPPLPRQTMANGGAVCELG